MQNQKSFKPGFDLLLAFVATIASCTLSAFLCAIYLALFFTAPLAYRHGLAKFAEESTSFFFSSFGILAAFFCFASTFIPNMIGLYLIIRGALKKSLWTNTVLGSRWRVLGALYGLLICGLGLLAFGLFAFSYRAPRRSLEELIMLPTLFALLSPAAIASGVLALQIVKMMLRRALPQKQNTGSLKTHD